jgi:hypothetical protein
MGPNGALVHLLTVQLGAEPSLVSSALLPATGQLVVFIDPAVHGYDPNNSGSCRILHIKAGIPTVSSVGPTSLPQQEFQVHPTWVEPAKGSVFPVSLGKAPREESPENHLLGYPYPEQRNTMELQCQLTSNGFYTGNDSGYNDPKAQILKAGADNWRLLLQLQSMPELPLMFGDQGVLYLFCPLNDAGQMDLGKCWQLVQS